MGKATKYSKVVSKEGYVSVSPMPSAEELERHYSKYYEQPHTSTYHTSYSDDELKQRRLRARLMMHALEKASGYKPDISKLFLEIGCGEGFVMQAAQDAGYGVRGFDFTDFGLRAFHPELSRHVKTGDAYVLLEEEIVSGTVVDVCVLQNILEHVVDERELLRMVHRAIRNNGIAVVTVPNDFSPLQKRLGELKLIDQEYWFAPPEHLQYFNIESLTRLMRNEGFEILDAYGDFPIEMYLFHPGSNYVREPSAGKAAHQARVTLDLLLSQKGLDPYLSFCRAMTACDIGRTVTMIVRSGEAVSG